MDEWTNIGGAIDMKVVFTLVVISILSFYISDHHRHHHRRCHHPHIIIILHVKVYTEPMEDGPINLANNKCEHHAPKVDSNSNEVALTFYCNALIPPTFMGKMPGVKQSCFCRIRTD